MLRYKGCMAPNPSLPSGGFRTSLEQEGSMRKLSNRAFLITAAATLSSLAATTVSAAPPAGQLLASQCAQCHGTNGAGPGFDKIAGKSADDLYGDLIEMKYSTQIESIMDRQARGYTDAQLYELSNYLATLPSSEPVDN
jgi:cytochrome subunit of sulfide dehydrogenase